MLRAGCSGCCCCLGTRMSMRGDFCSVIFSGTLDMGVADIWRVLHVKGLSMRLGGWVGGSGGWKLVIGDAHRIATWWHDCTDCHWGPYWNVKSIYTRAPSLVWNESRSVDTARWVLDCLLMAFDDGKSSLRGFPRNYSNASFITLDYSRQSRAHLAVSTDPSFVPNKQGHCCVNRFHTLLWAPMAACMIMSFTLH